MAEGIAELETVMTHLFRLRGILDPGTQAAGIGASISEALALRFLADGGPVPQQDIGAFLNLEKSTVSRLVEAMTAKGWVTKEQPPGNRRLRTVSLTAAGEHAAREIGQAIRNRHANMLAALSARERQALSIALPALIRVLTATS